MLRTLLDLLPVDALSKAEVLVFQDGDRAGVDLLQRVEVQGLQRRLHNIERGEEIEQLTTANHFQVPEELERKGGWLIAT